MPSQKNEETIDWGDEEFPKTLPPSGTMEEPEYEGATVRIVFKWTEAHNDPIDFKPYSPLLIPQDIFIVVDVPEPLVISHQEDSEGLAIDAVLSLEGYIFVQHKLSLAIKKAYYKGD